jgi:hypothetical protein
VAASTVLKVLPDKCYLDWPLDDRPGASSRRSPRSATGSTPRSAPCSSRSVPSRRDIHGHPWTGMPTPYLPARRTRLAASASGGWAELARGPVALVHVSDHDRREVAVARDARVDHPAVQARADLEAGQDRRASAGGAAKLASAPCAATRCRSVRSTTISRNRSSVSG